MPEQTLRQFVKEWVTANCNDGEDRSQAEGDRHCYSGKRLYEEFDELAQAIEERALEGNRTVLTNTAPREGEPSVAKRLFADVPCHNGLIFVPDMNGSSAFDKKALDKLEHRHLKNKIQEEKMKLVYEKTGEPVKIGDITEDFRGSKVIVKSIVEPHKPSSTGRVYTVPADDPLPEWKHECFPSVIGAKWIDREGPKLPEISEALQQHVADEDSHVVREWDGE